MRQTGTEAQAAELILELMTAAMRLSSPFREGEELQYTLSAGIAEARPGDTVEDFLRVRTMRYTRPRRLGETAHHPFCFLARGNLKRQSAALP